MKRFLNAILVVALLLSLPMAAKAGPSKSKKSKATGHSKLISVIIHTSKPYGPVITGIQDLGGTVTIQYENVDAVAAQIPANKWREIASLRQVESMGKDYIVNLPQTREDGLGLQTLGMEGGT